MFGFWKKKDAMTEAQREAAWLTEIDPKRLLEIVLARVSPRKLRRFVCACARQRWHWLEDERSRRAVEVAERFADGRATDEELARAHQEAEAARVPGLEQAWAELSESMGVTREELASYIDGPQLVNQTAYTQAWETKPAQGSWAGMAISAAAPERDWPPAYLARKELGRAMSVRQRWGEEIDLLALLRCLFGNPFRPALPLAPAWLAWNGGSVVQLAQAIYEDRRFEDLPVLADALEEAGCTDNSLLDHCRGFGPHARGCWVVDLLLGKS